MGGGPGTVSSTMNCLCMYLMRCMCVCMSTCMHMCELAYSYMYSQVHVYVLYMLPQSTALYSTHNRLIGRITQVQQIFCPVKTYLSYMS